MQENTPKRLHVIWSSADPDVAHKMVFMYTKNSRLKDWWEEVELIVWGPSARLLAGDPALQEAVLEMKAAGVSLSACKACSDSYGVSDDLAALGIDVRYMGTDLTAYLKSGEPVLTF